MPYLQLRREIIAVVEQQLANHDPPETSQTLERLVNAGYRRQAAVAMIGSALMTEIHDMLRDNRSFDRAHFKTLLDQLR